LLLNNIRHLKKINIRIIKILLVFFVITIIYKTNTIFAATKAAGISAFPASYQVYLKQLQKLHPNWSFTALNTGINWYEAVKNEGPSIKLERSAVPLSFAEVWKWKNSNGKYNVIEEGWVTASELAIGYSMDPRRYLNEMNIFQFETLNYDSTLQNQEGVEQIFYGTLMYQRNITYIDVSGKTQTINKTYSKVVMEAAAKYGVSPYHLASRIKQETGCDTQNNTSIKGNVSGYVGLYNYYNIGATGGDNPAISGLAYARTMGWTTPEKAIHGGAAFLAEKYISVGQYTTYLQKFNVNDDASSALYTHQYMQNILAPANESISVYNAYSDMGLLDIPFNFVIPVYNNMPESPVDIYVQDPDDYVTDSTKVYSTVNLNIRSGPGTNNSTMLTVKKGTVMTRIARGVQAGERWDKVKLDTGVEGYVFQSYMKEYSYVKVTGVSLNEATIEISPEEMFTLSATILPSNAEYKEVYWATSDNEVATVSDTGIVTAKKEGTAIITVITEDQLKEAVCVVNVVKKEPTITLDKGTYNIIKGKEATLNVTIKDSDISEHEASIEDEAIAILEDGKIKGISSGTTKLTVNIKGTDIKTEAIINVIELSEGEISIDESLIIDGDVLSKISPETKAYSIKEKIQTIHNISIKNLNNEDISDDKFVCTGSKIQIINSENELIYEYNVLIYGDVNSDGKINSGDLLAIVKHLNKNNVFENEMILKASDVTLDGKINSGDLLKIVKYLNGITSLGN